MKRIINKFKQFISSFTVILSFIKVTFSSKFELNLKLPEISLEINKYYFIQLKNNENTSSYQTSSKFFSDITSSFFIFLISLFLFNNLFLQRFQSIVKFTAIFLLIIISISSIFLYIIKLYHQSIFSRLKHSLIMIGFNLTILHMIHLVSNAKFSFLSITTAFKQIHSYLSDSYKSNITTIEFINLPFVQIIIFTLIFTFILCYLCNISLLFTDNKILKNITKNSWIIICFYYLIYYFDFILLALVTSRK